MSQELSLARTYVNTVRDLAQGRPVRVAIPGMGVVSAIPSIVDGPDGEELVQLEVDMQAQTRVGAIEGQGTIRMSPQTFKAGIEKAQAFAPRFEAVGQRALRRLGGG